MRSCRILKRSSSLISTERLHLTPEVSIQALPERGDSVTGLEGFRASVGHMGQTFRLKICSMLLAEVLLAGDGGGVRSRRIFWLEKI